MSEWETSNIYRDFKRITEVEFCGDTRVSVKETKWDDGTYECVISDDDAEFIHLSERGLAQLFYFLKMKFEGVPPNFDVVEKYILEKDDDN